MDRRIIFLIVAASLAAVLSDVVGSGRHLRICALVKTGVAPAAPAPVPLYQPPQETETPVEPGPEIWLRPPAQPSNTVFESEAKELNLAEQAESFEDPDVIIF